MFGLAAALLTHSEVFSLIVTDSPFGDDSWRKRAGKVGRAWRRAVEGEGDVPKDVATRWSKLLAATDLPIHELGSRPKLARCVVELLAFADEAADGAGVRFGASGSQREFLREATLRLWESGESGEGSTLCSEAISGHRLRVLPKLHTPQSGLNLRSLSHHLALCPGGSVTPRWYTAHWALGNRGEALNLLVLPWPRRVMPADFRHSRPGSSSDHAYFEFAPKVVDPEEIVAEVKALLGRARSEVGPIGGVVLPEAALTREQFEALEGLLLGEGIFLISGVRSPATATLPGKNYAGFTFPFVSGLPIQVRQSKHHRWRLDRRQIRQYGLSQLHPDLFWWEDIKIPPRELQFVVLGEWGTICVLICEDLARQEPVSEMLRAVGPNLVVALLQDGPQLSMRWPARYATVLSDDPGCSVLSVTSLGMAQLSRAEDGSSGSRVIALWKDDKDGRSVPVTLSAGAEAVVLTLARERKPEWTADGRPGPDRAYYPTLMGYHCVNSSPGSVAAPKGTPQRAARPTKKVESS
jgi:hypothetical protein